jgi:ABC-type arginine transport system ATPase subunit
MQPKSRTTPASADLQLAARLGDTFLKAVHNLLHVSATGAGSITRNRSFRRLSVDKVTRKNRSDRDERGMLFNGYKFKPLLKSRQVIRK